MTKRRNHYVGYVISLIVLILIVFIFNLPKMNSFIIIGVIALFNIFLDLVIGTKDNE